MQADTALRIVSALANGCDPETGEVLHNDHVLQRSDTIRALGVALAALQSIASSETRKNRNPARTGIRWNGDEDKELLTAFDDGAAIGALADKHERTRGAIKSRLIRLGRLGPDGQPLPATTSDDGADA